MSRKDQLSLIYDRKDHLEIEWLQELVFMFCFLGFFSIANRMYK